MNKNKIANIISNKFGILFLSAQTFSITIVSQGTYSKQMCIVIHFVVTTNHTFSTNKYFLRFVNTQSTIVIGMANELILFLFVNLSLSTMNF